MGAKEGQVGSDGEERTRISQTTQRTLVSLLRALTLPSPCPVDRVCHSWHRYYCAHGSVRPEGRVLRVEFLSAQSNGLTSTTDPFVCHVRSPPFLCSSCYPSLTQNACSGPSSTSSSTSRTTPISKRTKTASARTRRRSSSGSSKRNSAPSRPYVPSFSLPCRSFLLQLSRS